MLRFYSKHNAITHRVIDVVKALARWEAVVWINAFQTTNSQEHSNGRTKCKKGLRMECQLWIIDRNLGRDGKVGKMC